MLNIVAWKWKPSTPDYRSTFGPDQVNTLKRMVDRHYVDPHRFLCVTDDPSGFDPSVEVVPLWNDFADIPNPHNPQHPSCYRRLKAFAPEMAHVLGPRFVSVDLDCVIVDDVRPVWNRPEPFVGWGGTHSATPYNGSMFLMTAGARAKVWQEFHPKHSPRIARQAGYYGSDQAWMSKCLGPNEPRWSHTDGVYSYRVDIAPAGGLLPKNARIVFFNGRHDPWGPRAQQLDWVKEHWR